jgi:D-alanine-D-alanine ligase
MSKRLNLALLYGGKSGEHEISLVSAASVFAHLDRERFNVFPIGIDKSGCFFLNDEAALHAFSQALPVEGPNAKPLSSLIENGQFVLPIDVVFPVLHGPLYEDGAIQGMLELGNVAYVGCDILSSAIGMDKDMARKVACNDTIQCVAYRRISWFADEAEINQFCDTVIADLGFPLFVKPCRLGSSVGTHKANDKAALKNAIMDARRYDKEVLVESFIKAREIEVAVLEYKNPAAAPRVSIPGEIKVNHPDGFYSYTAKYLESNQTALLIPAPLTPEMAQ